MQFQIQFYSTQAKRSYDFCIWNGCGKPEGAKETGYAIFMPSNYHNMRNEFKIIIAILALILVFVSGLSTSISDFFGELFNTTDYQVKSQQRSDEFNRDVNATIKDYLERKRYMPDRSDSTRK